MSLYVPVGEKKVNCATWHIGEDFPLGPADIENDGVKWLQADGDELQLIKRKIGGIPMHNGNVVKWFGDHATFIASVLQQDACRIRA